MEVYLPMTAGNVGPVGTEGVEEAMEETVTEDDTETEMEAAVSVVTDELLATAPL
jgi:hypothetical protein